MVNLKTAALCMMACLQAGCVANESKVSMKPAVLTETSVATTKLLNATMSDALNGTRVMVTRDALTKNSEYTIERRAQSDAFADGLNGNLQGKPQVYRFSLLADNAGNCYLIYQKTGQKYPLDGVSCRPL